jgi:di/tricarboxylate transporter
VLRADDTLLVRCSIEKIRALQERTGVQFKPHVKWGDETIAADEYRLLEAIVEPNSRLVGSTLQRSNFRGTYGATVLAIRHRGRLLREKLSDTVLGAGDLLLIEIERDRIGQLRQTGDFIVTSEMEVTEFRRKKAITAVLVVAAVVGAAALGLAPIVVTAVVGSVAMVLLGCISIEEAYEAIEWKIIFLLAGALSLGVALDESGAARLISANMVGYVGGYGLIALVSAFYLLTSILTEAMTNNATAALLGPIAIATAATLGVSPIPFLVAITFAASSSFMTPVGYKTNTMIYGPGQYAFTDFLRVGTPLNILFWIVATIFIPMFWSF